jgi:hypothetical protein
MVTHYIPFCCPNTSAWRFSGGLMVHTVVSMTWVWQELSDEGLP